MKVKTLLYSWLLINSGASAQPLTIDPQDIAGNFPDNATSKITAIAENGSHAVGTVTIKQNSQAFIINLDNLIAHDLGTLQSDNQGYSEATSISNDGSVIAGWADTNTSRSQAFVFRIGDTHLTPIGTFRANNIGYSSAHALSGDGQVVVGEADVDARYSHAFRYLVSSGSLSDLGTLRAKNQGYSSATAVSDDGSILTGNSDTDYGSSQAFFYRDGSTHLTGIGTLRSDNKGSSQATAISADGKIIVGSAQTDRGVSQAFRYSIDELQMTGLGSLRADNSGSSLALATSADGNVIVGNAASDSGGIQAFLYNAGDRRMTNLGSLQTDNNGPSYAYAISADGQVVVGSAHTDSGDSQAYLYRQGNAKMTGLGTLRRDNSGSSVARVVNHDGTLIAGSADTDAGETHATLWRIKYPAPVPPVNPPVTPPPVNPPVTPPPVNPPVTPPPVNPPVTPPAVNPPVTPPAVNPPVTPPAVNPPVTPPQDIPQEKPEITIIDVINSRQAMADTAKRSYQVLDLYQQALTSLSDQRCYSTPGNRYCLKSFFQADAMQGNRRDSAGFNASMSLLADGSLVSGIALSFPLGGRINDNYRFRNNLHPGIAGYLQYHRGTQPAGLTVALSMAGIRDNVTIQRNTRANTEAGKGHSTIKGYTASAEASYTFVVSEPFFFSPFTGLRYSSLTRDGYQENRDIAFPAHFERLEIATTELQSGLKTQYQLAKTLRLNSQFGVSTNLSSRSNGFQGDIEYAGGFSNKPHENHRLRPFMAIGLTGNVTANAAYTLQAGYQKNSSNKGSTQVGFNFSLGW